MKNIVVLGSTGSIGKNVLDVASQYKDKFRIVGLSANNNVELLARQARDFNVKQVCIGEERNLQGSKRACLFKEIDLLKGPEGLNSLASRKDVDLVIVALVGSSGLLPILSAINAGKNVAIANKEPLVMAGKLITDSARKNNVDIIPIDSEHSAILQCLNGQKITSVKKIILTASGGSLYNVDKNKIDSIPVKKILDHPRWQMGKKISVDSATLLNKGFEVIEAAVLFDVSIDKLDVIIHPESVIHSMVEFANGSVMAQMGVCDMRIPIQYAMTYPERVSMNIESLDLVKIRKLHFFKPDFGKFPCLRIAYEAAKEGGTAPCVLSAADEELVGLLLDGKIKLSCIAKILEKILSLHKCIKSPSLRSILECEDWSKNQVRRLCNQ